MRASFLELILIACLDKEIPFLSLYLVKSFYEGQTGKKLKNLEGQSTIS